MLRAVLAGARRHCIPGLAVLVAVVTVWTWTRRTAFPLLNDDVAYLGNACRLANLESLEWGPAYAALYCALRRVFPDPFVAFWTKQAAVLLLAGALVYRLALRFGVGPVLAPLAGVWCVFALLSPNGTLEFAFVLGLVACLSAASNTGAGWAGFFAIMGLAFLVRTEYLVGIAAALVLLLWRRHGTTRKVTRRAFVAGAVVLAGCLALAWGKVPTDNGRSWFAFGQQFAVNYAEAHAVPGDPLVDWRRIAAQSFPASGSIQDAIRENPRMFAWHLGYNVLTRVPRALARLLLPVRSFAAWPSPGSEVLGAVVLLAGLLAAARGAMDPGRLGDPRVTPLLAVAVIPCVSLLFRPQSRHFLPILPLVLVLAGHGLLSSAGQTFPRLRTSLGFVLGAVLLVGMASPWFLWLGTPRVSPSLADRIRELRQAAEAGPVRVLASWCADRVCALVGPRCQAASFDERGEDGHPLSDFIDAQRVDAILISPDWAARPDVQADAQVMAFLAQPRGRGCVADPPAEGLRFVRCHPPLKLTQP